MVLIKKVDFKGIYKIKKTVLWQSETVFLKYLNASFTNSMMPNKKKTNFTTIFKVCYLLKMEIRHLKADLSKLV